MAESSAVSSGDLATIAHYNNLRNDVLSTTLGHFHDGTNGRQHGDSNFKWRNPAGTYSYTIRTGAIVANRDLTIPVITGNDTLAVLGLAQTFSAVKTFSAEPVFNDNIAVALGAAPGGSRLYYDGTDTKLNLRAAGTGDLLIGFGGTLPTGSGGTGVDANSVHIWGASAGDVAANGIFGLVIEDDADVQLQLLGPNGVTKQINFGEPASNIRGRIVYSGTGVGDKFEFTTAAALQMSLDATNLTLVDNNAAAFGSGADSRIFYDGTDTKWDLRATGCGDLIIALAGSFPSPDPGVVHLWKGTAGTVTADGDMMFVLESSNTGVGGMTILGPNTQAKAIIFGEPESTSRAQIRYYGSTDTPEDTFAIFTANGERLRYSAAAFAFQEATTISSTAGAITFSPTTDVIIADGKGLIVGHTAQITGFVTAEFQVLGTSQADSSMIVAHFGSTTSEGANLDFVRSPQGTIGSHQMIRDNDVIGRIRFFPDDNTDFATLAAEILVVVDDASPATGDVGMEFVFNQMPGGGGASTSTWRMNAAGQFSSIINPSNVTADSSGIFEGGIAFTDVANAHIDDATHGAGTVTHYIGNETIDTTASDVRLKTNFSAPTGLARHHLGLLSEVLEEYDYLDGPLANGRFVGYGAQHLHEVLPQYVSAAEGDNMWSVHYKYMVGPLLWGWRDHEDRIAELEEELRELKAK